jgi:hypothetical protein
VRAAGGGKGGEAKGVRIVFREWMTLVSPRDVKLQIIIREVNSGGWALAGSLKS